MGRYRGGITGCQQKNPHYSHMQLQKMIAELYFYEIMRKFRMSALRTGSLFIHHPVYRGRINILVIFKKGMFGCDSGNTRSEILHTTPNPL